MLGDVTFDLLPFFFVIAIIRLYIKLSGLDVFRVNLPGILQQGGQFGDLRRIGALRFLRRVRLGFNAERQIRDIRLHGNFPAAHHINHISQQIVLRRIYRSRGI
ncbi:hypothetical protein D1872_298950 [compost metagenome]